MWLGAFVVVQVVVFGAVLAVDPAGLDRCDATHPPGPRGVQAAIVGAGSVLALGLAVGLLRGRVLLVAAGITVIPALGWTILLTPGGSC